MGAFERTFQDSDDSGHSLELVPIIINNDHITTTTQERLACRLGPAVSGSSKYA